MTEKDIYLNCGNARSDAAALKEQALTIREAARQYAEALTDLGNVWTGESAQMLIGVGKQRITRMRRAASRLDDLADAIVRTANIYQRNELIKLRAVQSKH